MSISISYRFAGQQYLGAGDNAGQQAVEAARECGGFSVRLYNDIQGIRPVYLALAHDAPHPTDGRSPLDGEGIPAEITADFRA